MPSLKKKDGYHAPAVERAFRLLRHVAEANNAPRLSDLAGHLNISKGSAHGLIKTLVATGALTQDTKSKRLSLGPAIVELALKDQTYLRLGARAQPALDELQNTIRETVFFGLMHPWKALIMATSEARSPMKISSMPGSTIPLLAGALGKLFLSQQDDRQVEEIIQEQGLPAYTPASITDEKAYIKEVANVREAGAAVDIGEYMSGVNALAVGAHKSQPLALWVVGFSGSLDDEKITRITKTVQAAAERLSEDLGTGG